MTQVGLVKRIFKLNLTVMRFWGFYPTKKSTKLYKFYACLACLCVMVIPVLAAVYLIVGENVDAAEVRDSLFLIFQLWCFILKVLPFIFNPKVVRKTIYMIERPIFSKWNDTEKEIIEDLEKVCRRNNWLFLGFCVISSITWTTTPFFGNVRKFPLKIWLPFEATFSLKVFIPTYIFIVTCVASGGFSNGVIDPLLSGMVYFAVSQIRIIKKNLENLSVNSDKKIDSNLDTNIKRSLKNKIIYEDIKECIEHHMAVLEFIAKYENVYSFGVFIQFITACIVICATCWQLSKIEPFTYPFFAMNFFLLTMVLEIFLYCYGGACLYEESNSLTTAIYMGSWYEYNIQCKKALVIFMERSKKPIIVTAGKILDLSLNTFTTILRRAYSLLAVLKNY